MEFAKRILKVKPSQTLEITALANSLKAKGIDVIGFGSGEPDFDTPDSIKEAAIRSLKNGKTKYTPVGGIVTLKEAIIQKFKRDNNLDYSINEVVVNCGGKHSFYNLMQVLLNDDDEVIVPSPYWVSYPPMILLAGGTPIFLETNEENGFKITSDSIKKAITSRTKAIIINSPSNPTGATYCRDELQNLAKELLEHDILVISDDIYESLLYEDIEFCNIANLSEELKKRTMVLNGVSKAYSMTGWRIGYMAGDEKIIKKVEIIQSQSTSNPTSISQWAALEALMGDQSFVINMAQAFKKRRKIITDRLNEIIGVNYISPGGAFYIFPNIKGVFKLKGWQSIKEKYHSQYNSTTLSSYLLEEAKVAVVPGIAFGSDDNIRLSFATSEENIIEGTARIKEAIEKIA